MYKETFFICCNMLLKLRCLLDLDIFIVYLCIHICREPYKNIEKDMYMKIIFFN